MIINKKEIRITTKLKPDAVPVFSISTIPQQPESQKQEPKKCSVSETTTENCYRYTMFWLTKLDEIVKNNPSICPKNCGRKFGGQNRKDYMLKKNDVYANENPVYCPKNCGRCYKGMWRKYNLQKHLKYECGVAPQFKCLACPKSFSLKANLKMHMLVVHKIILGTNHNTMS
ncbi:myc-associated zinc finger protein-like [Acyrthosiphon pisum]|uniref:C2H2-type domain-containing protein n=1 Tax=Acyrthosiphon pisum TaxID=7029 RepID=A0A8R2NSY2_ACYPI|nr:myc-associated zinc finger protein-like [Acyrthosiphon pisum]